MSAKKRRSADARAEWRDVSLALRLARGHMEFCRTCPTLSHALGHIAITHGVFRTTEAIGKCNHCGLSKGVNLNAKNSYR